MNTPVHSTVSTISRYPAALVGIHWLVAVLVLTAYVSGDHPTRDGWLGELHVFCGLAVAALLLLRLPLRLLLRRRLPRFALPQWQQWSAVAVQAALYGCMLLIPLSGLLALAEETAQFRVFGMMLTLPDWALSWEEVGEIHEVLGNVFIALAGVHAAAALLHHFVFKDKVLHSMR